MSQFAIGWLWRSLEPAKCQPDPEFPFGKACDMSGGQTPACKVEVSYPAPGVGTWIVNCGRCGLSVGVTAAGRADDPTFITIACREGVNARA